MAILIRNGYVATMNAAREVHAGGFVQVGDDGRIAAVGAAADAPAAFDGEVIDAEGMIVTPGLVNACQHPWQHLVMGLEGAATPAALARWRQALTPADLRVAAGVAAAEMLAGGTTCVLHYVPPVGAEDALAAAIEPIADAGLRQAAVLDHGATGAAAFDAALARWQGAHGGRTRRAVQVASDAAAVAAGTVHERGIAAAYRFAVANGLRITSDTWPQDAPLAWDDAMRRSGRSTPVHLMELGVLDANWLLALGRAPSAADRMLLRESGCFAVATPLAEAMRGQALDAWTDLLRAGVPLALGSGGAALSCSADMVEQMKALVLIQNTVRLDPTAMGAEAALEMATIQGARALGLDAEIGSLEPGKRADVAVFDMRGPHYQATHKPISTFVCCGRGADAHLVLVDGRVAWRAAPGTVAAWDRALALAHDGLAHGDALMARAPAIA